MSIIKSIKLSNTKYDLNDARISSNDITNWNGKTSNVGTVVGIQMNGGSTISPDADGIIDLGTLITSHQSISGKADKVSNSTSGNFAGLDSNGNLTDSGNKASDFATASSVTTIEEKIPTQASSSNLLADKNFVNSSISTATATFQGTYNLVNDLSLTTSATESGIATALATAVSSADSNDYVFVLVPTADGTPTEISHVDRYKYNGTAWAYEYTLNNSSFTSAQWAAINSGITSSIVSAISNKYELPSGGIPATDLATAVLTSLGLADTAVQPSALNDYVTLATDLNITGVKTFLGLKKIAFKQSSSSDKLGFTLFANDGTEKGYLEFNGSNKVDNIPLMTLGNYAQATAGLTQIGFRKYSSISGASGAYNLIAPLISDARTPFSLTTTYTNFYLPLGFTDGTTTVKTAKTGVVDLSSLIPDVSNYILKSNTAGLVKNDGTIDTSTYLTSAPVTSVNGETGAVSLTIPDDSTLLHYTYSDNYNYVVESYFAVNSIRIDSGDVRGRLLINDEYDADIYLNDEYEHRWGIIKGSWGETLQQALDARNNVKANWNETDTSSAAYILNKPTIPSISTQTAYSAKGSATKVPLITTNTMGLVTSITEITITQPTVNDSTITLLANGSTIDTFTTNASSAKTINLGNLLTSTTSGLKIEVVSALPASPDSNTIYIVTSA